MGDKLKSLRIDKKMTQKQVADRIGLAISAVSSYESGSRYPSYDVLLKLARIFHVSTDYLLGITETRNIDVTGLNDDEINAISQLVDMLRNKQGCREIRCPYFLNSKDLLSLKFGNGRNKRMVLF